MPREERTQLPPRKREKPAPKDKDAANGASNAKDGAAASGKTRHHGGRRGKRYNTDDAPNDKADAAAASSKKDAPANKANKDSKEAAPSSSRGGHEGRGRVRGGRGALRGGRGRGRGSVRRFNDDFDVQPSKLPRDHLDSRPHQNNKEHRNANNRDRDTQGADR